MFFFFFFKGIEARVNVTVSEYVLPRYEVRIKLDQQSISQQIINPSSYSSQSGMGHEGEAASGGATSTKKPASEPSLDKTPFLTGTIDALYTYSKLNTSLRRKLSAIVSIAMGRR